MGGPGATDSHEITKTPCCDRTPEFGSYESKRPYGHLLAVCLREMHCTSPDFICLFAKQGFITPGSWDIWELNEILFVELWVWNRYPLHRTYPLYLMIEQDCPESVGYIISDRCANQTSSPKTLRRVLVPLGGGWRSEMEGGRDQEANVTGFLNVQKPKPSPLFSWESDAWTTGLGTWMEASGHRTGVCSQSVHRWALAVLLCPGFVHIHR